MITAFSELDFKIVEIGVVGAGRGKTLDEHVFVFLIKSSVNGFLNVSHFYVDDGFLERRDGLFDILFHSTEHVGFEDFVETLDLLLR